MVRNILILAAACLLAQPVDAQTCRPGDACYQGERIGGLVIVTDTPAAPRVVVRQPRRVVVQAPATIRESRTVQTPVVTYAAPVVTYYSTTTTQPAVTKTVRKRWFRRGTVTTYHYHR